MNQYQQAPFQPAAYHHANAANQESTPIHTHNHHSHHNNHHNHHHYTHHNHHHHNNNNNNNNHHHNHHYNHHNNFYNHHHGHNNNNNNNNQNNTQHQHTNSQKYNRKYNLISFVLLRKSDEYFIDDNYYLNDESIYQNIMHSIEKHDIETLKHLLSIKSKEEIPQYNETNSFSSQLNATQNSLNNLLSTEMPITSYCNSYNCNLFIFTLRECLTSMSKCDNDKKNFYENLIDFLFTTQALANNFYMQIDGDYPARNIMHYAIKHDNTQVYSNIIKSINSLAQKDDIMLKLFFSLDYNLNTPIHLAAMNNSVNTLKMVPVGIVKKCEHLYNDDGLNPLLLACKHSSIDCVKYLIDTCGYEASVRERKFASEIIDDRRAKNALYLTCARFNALELNIYLLEKCPKLAYQVTDLCASVYHVLASNINRLSEFDYFLNKFDASLDKHDCLNRADFRQFSCVDAFFDTIINLRLVVPLNQSVYEFFFNSFDYNYENANYQIQFRNDYELNLVIKRCLFKLVEKCKAKIFNLPQIKNRDQLLEFLKVIVFLSKLHVRTQFSNSMHLSKFEAFSLKFLNTYIFTGDLLNINNNTNSNNTTPNRLPEPQSPANATTAFFDSNSNCNPDQNNNNMRKIQSTPILNSLSRFFEHAAPNSPSALTASFFGESARLLCSSLTSSKITSSEQTLLLIYSELIELARIVLLSGRYSVKFQKKILVYLKNFLGNSAMSLNNSGGNNGSNSPTPSPSPSPSPKSFNVNFGSNGDGSFDIESGCMSVSMSTSQLFCSFINLKLAELMKINRASNVLKLKDYCRMQINAIIDAQHRKMLDADDCRLSRSSLLSLYLRLPQQYHQHINFLTFYLIDDLYGAGSLQSSFDALLKLV